MTPQSSQFTTQEVPAMRPSSLSAQGISEDVSSRTPEIHDTHQLVFTIFLTYHFREHPCSLYSLPNTNLCPGAESFQMKQEPQLILQNWGMRAVAILGRVAVLRCNHDAPFVIWVFIGDFLYFPGHQ